MFPYPIPAYPTNPPPKWPGATVADCTFTMPECNVIVDGAELAARYEMGRSGECYGYGDFVLTITTDVPQADVVSIEVSREAA